MYDILIGNKKDNVVNKLKTSWIARILFIGCCWYLYDMFGRSGSMRIEIIFMIAVIGAMLVNVFYIPFRLLGNKRIEHRVKLIFIVVVDVMALHFFNATERFSIASVWKNMISVVVISLCVTGIVVTVQKYLAVHSQSNSYRWKDFDSMTGWEFESWSAEWLRQHGFDNVEVTKGSGDYGADVICSKNGETYAVQCKKYSGKVTYRAVEEVICAKNYYGTDRAMIFTNSELTPQADEAAKKLGVVVYDGTVILR